MTHPDWDSERDLTDPFKNPPREGNPGRWGTRPQEASWVTKRRRARVAVAITAVVGFSLALVTYAGFTLARSFSAVYAEPVATSGTEQAQPAPVATPSQPAPVVTPGPVVSPTTHDTSDMRVPDGWSIHSSPGGSGAFAYAYDPAWSDLRNSPEDQQFQDDAFAAAGDRPEGSVFLLGDWRRAASATMPAVTIRVVRDPVVGREGDLKTIVENYTVERATVEGDDNPERFYSGDYVHHLGYEGWRVMMWAHVDGETVALDVTGIRYKDAVVFTSMTTDGQQVHIDSVPASVVFLP